MLKGQVGVARAIEDIESVGGRAFKEITVETSVGRTRPDLYVIPRKGSPFFLEVKNGLFAWLRRNQRTNFAVIREEGGTIRASHIEGLPYGTRIGATPVYTVRYGGFQCW